MKNLLLIRVAAIVVTTAIAVGSLAGCGAPKMVEQPLVSGEVSLYGEGFWPYWGMISDVGQKLTMFDLVATRGDKLGDIAPDVCTSWEWSADGLTVTLKVRKGLKFHNGEALTAEDVAFSYTEGGMGADSTYKATWDAMIEKVEVVDDYTVAIRTKGKQPFVIYRSSYTFPNMAIIPKDYVTQNNVTVANKRDFFQRNPIGSGPYKFKAHTPGDSFEYEAWVEPGYKHWKGTPQFKYVTLVSMPEESTRVAAIKTGAIDITDIGIESAVELEKAGYTILKGQPWTVDWYMIGAFEPQAIKEGWATTNLKVRQALSYAINREELIKTYFHGLAGFPGPYSFSIDQPNITGSKFDKPNREIYAAYDPAKAKQLLKEANYPSAFAHPEIKILTFPIRGTPYLPELFEILAGYWADVGLQVKVTPYDYARWQVIRHSSKMAQGHAELYGTVSNWRASSGEIPCIQAAYFKSKGEGMDLAYTTLPELDAAIDAAKVETDLVKVKELNDKIVQLMLDTWCAPSIVSVSSMWAISKRVSLEVPISTDMVHKYFVRAKLKK